MVSLERRKRDLNPRAGFLNLYNFCAFFCDAYYIIQMQLYFVNYKIWLFFVSPLLNKGSALLPYRPRRLFTGCASEPLETSFLYKEMRITCHEPR